MPRQPRRAGATLPSGWRFHYVARRFAIMDGVGYPAPALPRHGPSLTRRDAVGWTLQFLPFHGQNGYDR